MRDITIFAAQKIITLDPNCPEATHVAVADGRILAVGGAGCADPWGGGRLDARFSDCVLTPGFVEGHAHVIAGALWAYPYIGVHDIPGPDGTLVQGLRDLPAVIARLTAHLATLPADAPLLGWGFDPIFLPGARLNRSHLDQVATDRPVLVLHSNGHLLTVNSFALDMVGYTADSAVSGLAKFPDGTPNGELRELAVKFPITRRLKLSLEDISEAKGALANYGGLARSVGVTTAADLMAALPEDGMDALVRETAAETFPIRLVPAYAGVLNSAETIIERMPRLTAQAHDKLRFGKVKLMADGSIQAFTSRMLWPGHLEGQPNGVWNEPPEQFAQKVKALHAAGIQMHIHANGDEAVEMVIDALAAAITAYPRPDHRHMLHHCQMANEAQFRRMAALGLGVNLFANHIWYFGDAHYARTMGPDRANRLDACRSALDHGVPLTIHSDAPVTPLNPLFSAWCAANRITPSGRVLGAYQRLTAPEALSAITLGAASSMHMDHEIGSIACGKWADFAVLDRDPLAEGRAGLRDVRVLGTVLAGRPQLA